MISICIIVKNEEKNLEECLRRLAAYDYEIVVVDTGSIDSSKSIALKYTDKVYDYIWNQDFSAARNYSISQASNDWILVIDSDEYVSLLDKTNLEKLISLNEKSIGRLLRINEFTRGIHQYRQHERVSRLFSRKYFQYEGIIHEQVAAIDGSQSIYFDIPIEMTHSGYEGDNIRIKKTERNIELLKKQLENQGEDPYVLYQLGKSYYMKEDYETAEKYFSKALYFDLDEKLEYVQDMIETYGYSLLEIKQFEKAMQLLNVYNEFAVNADFLFLIGLILMNNGKFKEAIEEFLKAAKTESCKMEGINSYMPFYNIGVIYECLGNITESIRYYKKCGDYTLAGERLRMLEDKDAKIY